MCDSHLFFVPAIVQVLFRRFISQGMTPEDAFLNSCESITGPITKTISKNGILPVYESLSGDDKKKFEEVRSHPHACWCACGLRMRSISLSLSRIEFVFRECVLCFRAPCKRAGVCETQENQLTREPCVQAYSASYKPAKDVLAEIYDEVKSGNEIRSVIMHGDRFEKFPIGKIDGTYT